MPKLLNFVEKTHPILREVMPQVKNFKSQNLNEAIENMCYSIMPEQLKQTSGHDNAAGMAANQWGVRKRIFIFAPVGSKEGKFEVMINPSYEPFLSAGELEPKMVAAYEGCFSAPLATGLINRYEKITASYYNTQGEKQEHVMVGYEARVFQHETDHLNGKLYDGRLEDCAGPECLQRIIFKDQQEMKDFWINTVRPSRGLVSKK